MAKNHYDQHLHTSFSYDAGYTARPTSIIMTAIEKGLTGIAITDHFDPLWPDENDMSYLEIPVYEKVLTTLADTFVGGRISFAKGIELGLIPGEALKLCEDVVSAYPYDFVLAGVHSSQTTPVDYPAFTDGRSLSDIIEEYYTLLLDSIRAYKNYDVIAHINNIDRYTDGFAPEELYMPYVDEILKTIIPDGKGIEINTSSFRYGIEAHGTPPVAVLKRFKELGGEIVTIGSDAHKIEDVGAYIEKGEDMLLASGFRYLAVYKNRKPEFIPL